MHVRQETSNPPPPYPSYPHRTHPKRGIVDVDYTNFSPQNDVSDYNNKATLPVDKED